nr:hypothetical protein [uncultured Roseateles sp.]
MVEVSVEGGEDPGGGSERKNGSWQQGDRHRVAVPALVGVGHRSVIGR